MIHSWWMRERLQALLDGELTEQRQIALVDHVGRCTRCASVLHHLAECDQLLISCRPVPGGLSPAASRALFERVMAEARADRRRPGRGTSLMAWGFTALLAIAASSAAAWWYHPDPPAHAGRTPAPRVASRDEETDTARVLETVFGDGPFDMDAVADSRGKAPPKAPVRSAVQHPGKPEPHPPRADGRGSEPRIRRPRPPSHRLIAVRDSLGSPLMPALVRRAHAFGDAGREPVSAEPSTGSAGQSIPADSGSDRMDDRITVQACDHEAVRLVSAALDGDPGALQRVAAAFVDDDSASSGPGTPPGSTEEARVPELSSTEWPLPWEGEDPDASERQEFLAPPQLLVMVSSEPAPPAVAVTDAPEAKPGYARAIACRPDASGHETWLQATASTGDKGTQTALVMLGNEVWEW